MIRCFEELSSRGYAPSNPATTIAYNTSTCQDGTSFKNQDACAGDSRCSSIPSHLSGEDTVTASEATTPRDQSVLDSMLVSMNALDITGKDKEKLREILAEVSYFDFCKVMLVTVIHLLY